jgi:hypothetical protein
VPEHLVRGVDDLAAALRAVADDPGASDPRPAADCSHPSRGRAHELADEIAATDPGEHDDGSAQLATQLHLLAADVAGLTEPVAPADRRAPADA